jgi:hypothetical protein
MLVGDVLSIDCNYVCDFAGSGVAVPDSRGSVFVGNVFGKRPLSFRSLALAETSASLDVAVPDDPHGLLDDPSVLIPPGWLQPEPGALAMTRHRSLISWMALNVV